MGDNMEDGLLTFDYGRLREVSQWLNLCFPGLSNSVHMINMAELLLTHCCFDLWVVVRLRRLIRGIKVIPAEQITPVVMGTVLTRVQDMIYDAWNDSLQQAMKKFEAEYGAEALAKEVERRMAEYVKDVEIDQTALPRLWPGETPWAAEFTDHFYRSKILVHGGFVDRGEVLICELETGLYMIE